MSITDFTLAIVNSIIIVVILFFSVYIWQSGKNRARLYLIMSLLVVPGNVLLFILGQQPETPGWIWPVTLLLNLLVFLTLCLIISYVWRTGKKSSLVPHSILMIVMAIVALSHALFSLFYW